MRRRPGRDSRRGASTFPRVESSATELPRVGPRSRAKGWAGRNGVTLRMPTSASDADISESIGGGGTCGELVPFERRAHILGQRPGVGDKRTLAAMRAAPDWRLHRSQRPILAEAVLLYHVAIGSDRVKNKIRPTPNWYLRFRCSAAYPGIKRRHRLHVTSSHL